MSDWIDHVNFDCELVKEACIQAGFTSFTISPLQLTTWAMYAHNPVYGIYVWADEHVHFGLARDGVNITMVDHNDERRLRKINLNDPRSLVQIAHWITNCSYNKKPCPSPYTTPPVLLYSADESGEVRLVKHVVGNRTTQYSSFKINWNVKFE